jgi:predicted nucleic acid-binding protein
LGVLQTERYVRFAEGFFTLLLDRPQVHGEWRRLAAEHRVVGRQVFDARMAASMSVHDVRRALTFDSGHFRPYPGIEVIHPADIRGEL